MKKTLFAALVAAVAIFATSCKKVSPTARFTYEQNGMEIKFINSSADADSYIWNFGDGSEQSTEQHPTHVYAASGEYTVVLTANNKNGSSTAQDVLKLTAPAAVQIDGDFSDWDKAIKDGKAVSTQLEAGVTYYKTAIQKFAGYMDEDFVYFMLAFVPDSVTPLDLYLGCSGERDDTELPGGTCTSYWDPVYVDYLVEFGKGDSFEGEDVTKYEWGNWDYSTQFLFDKEQGGWNFTKLNQNISTLSKRVVIDGLTYVEGKISRANFTFADGIDYVYMSCNSTYVFPDQSWLDEATGIAPAPTFIDGVVEYQPQLKVVMDKK